MPPRPRQQMVDIILPGQFSAERAYYPKALQRAPHALLGEFMDLPTEAVIARYRRRHPEADAAALATVLAKPSRHVHWAGADLFQVTDANDRRRMMLVEVNSCPAGQKSTPVLGLDPSAGYRRLVQETIVPQLGAGPGQLAVIYDKNRVEAQGMAMMLAEATGEAVYLARWQDKDERPAVRLIDGWLEVLDTMGRWQRLRAAIRYVTQSPWRRLPGRCHTRLLNPIVACLAGGRNKILASKAYERANADWAGTGVRIELPTTIADLTLDQIPAQVAAWGGAAVIKAPYTNAGQGIFTISNEAELAAFMAQPHRYDRFVAQAMIAGPDWGSVVDGERTWHVGTAQNRRGQRHVADLRMVVGSTPEGFRPIAVFGRRARTPLAEPEAGTPSWEILGTNLSRKQADGRFTTESARLLLMDERGLRRLGLELDDLVEAYVQAVLGVTAIDGMAEALSAPDGGLQLDVLAALNPDPQLIAEIVATNAGEGMTVG